MKTFWAAAVFWVFVAAMSTQGFGASRAEQWKAVETAIQRGLPQTAITNVGPLLEAALAERNYAEAVKALGMRINLESMIQGGKPEERILRLQKELPGAPAEMKPLLETLLAHWYWGYYQQNQWRFLQRTATAAAPSEDFTTWDLPRIFAEIDRHFAAALAGEATLKASPIGTWDALLEKGTMPDAYRPTLYDFIAHEALKFYSAGAQPLGKPEGAFEVAANSPALGSFEQFLAWELAPATNTPVSLNQRAIQIFQELLRFHRNDPAPRLAFAHADLERLTWAWNTAYGEDKNARYTEALRGFIKQYENNEISALASERLARLLQRSDDLTTAHEVASAAAAKFPNSIGGKLCKTIRQEIEAKRVNITTESVWNAPWPDILVRYANIEQVHFRAVAAKWEDYLDRRRPRPESLNSAAVQELAGRSAALQWSTNLPPTTDFQETAALVPAPSTLAPGFYFILVSVNADFSAADNNVSVVTVWVSDLALVTRPRPRALEGFVLNALSGEPISGAEVQAWHLEPNGVRAPHPKVSTDEQGFFTFDVEDGRSHLLLARHNGHALATRGEVGALGQEQPIRSESHTVFFTDRAIYRPGQIIQYKGICLWSDRESNRYEVLKGERVTVVFRDPNGQEIARHERQANDYGSFAGSFTAPRNTLMGEMSIRVEGRAPGATGLRVEEYKRPRFEVVMEPPDKAPKLNEALVLKGRATTYTGAAVDAAQVNYRVVRRTVMPWWWGGWRGGWWPGSGQEQEIAHGTTRTGADGAFTLEFIAAPDLSVPETNNPSFSFEITANVTDSAGETRSADRTARVGYTALEVRLAANTWQESSKPVIYIVTAATLDGQPQEARGKLKLYALKQPEKVVREPLEDMRPMPRPRPTRRGAASQPAEPPHSLSNPEHWPLGELVEEKAFATGTNGEQRIEFTLKPGAYRAVVESQDRFGKAVTGELTSIVLAPDETKLPIKVPQWIAAPDWEKQPGEEFVALWGTGYDAGRAFIEIEHRGRMLQRFWTSRGRTQQQVKFQVTEAMRGGFTLHVTQVRENRGLVGPRYVSVPWKNKELALSWERFVSKLEPGQKETWSLRIAPAQTNGTSSAALAAELVATLYDASLDAFRPHEWTHRFGGFYNHSSALYASFWNHAAQFQHAFGRWESSRESVRVSYREFPESLAGGQPSRVRRAYAFGRGLSTMSAVPQAAPAAGERFLADAASSKGVQEIDRFSAGDLNDAQAGRPFGDSSAGGPRPPSAAMSPRKNLNETAFFFPQATTESNGIVRLTFAMPEAVTRWKFMGFAHDAAMRSGFIEGQTVTARELMVQPNPPRFLREGDAVEFTVKVLNQSDEPQKGKVRLNFAFAVNEQSADALLGNSQAERDFEIPAKESRSFSWRITVPDNAGFITYKAVASTERFADGEEGAVPVLSRRILVTESLPLPIRGATTRSFKFEKLLASGGSDSLVHESLTAQMVSNPAWYAVLALPYLMEFPHECSEQVFNRLYANSLARNIATQSPRIRSIFDQWKNTPALDSPLEKNQDLKAVTLEETPWLRQAKKESEARRNVGVLFDENRLNTETAATLEKLAQMQLEDGAWPWFPGGRADDFITLYITTGFGRLRHLGVDVPTGPALRALARMDAWIAERHRKILERTDPAEHVPSSTEALYLYGRSFFLKDRPLEGDQRTAVDFFIKQSRKFWLQTRNRQTQAHLALALQRFASVDRTTDRTPMDIMNSLREHSVSNEEMGMFWRDTEQSWWWYRAPIETQALMIEAFDEVARDEKAVEDCRVWLLKQKQTQDWRTTKATSDAVYALLLRGRDLLSSDALVQLRLGELDLTPVNTPGQPANPNSKRATVEPGTGFYEVRFASGEIRPELGNISVTKTDAGVAWGSVHWQYLEDVSKVTPHTNTPLTLRKTLYIKRNTSSGPVIAALQDALAPGDELVTRVELRTDRDMEYVHLKDQRGSGTEPVNVLSRYKFQDGLAYYESTRDTATHFFIDYLPKGTYVFEYSSRVQLRGEYQSGIAHIECMYAPEFNSHSGSVPLVVK